MEETKVTSGAELRKKSRPFITNPETGNTYQVRRPTLAAYIRAGGLPENFVARTLEGLAGGAQDEDARLTDAKILDSEDAVQALITTTLLNPRVVEHAEADDETEYEDIPPSDRDFIHKWAKGQGEVETTGGGVAVEDLAGFRDGARGEESAGAGPDGALLRAEAVESVGAA